MHKKVTKCLDIKRMTVLIACLLALSQIMILLFTLVSILLSLLFLNSNNKKLNMKSLIHLPFSLIQQDEILVNQSFAIHFNGGQDFTPGVFPLAQVAERSS